MTLEDGVHDLPRGHLAMVVTHLEMTEPAPERPVPVPVPEGWALTRIKPTYADYIALFRRVGEEWLWQARLTYSEDKLTQIISHPDVLIWTLRKGGNDAALLELDHRQPGRCELAYFGLAEDLIGTGAGRFLMNTAIREAFARPIERFHVQTCTLDSPQALAFYRRSGFEPVRQKVEVMRDPRLAGLIPRDRGQHAPLFD